MEKHTEEYLNEHLKTIEDRLGVTFHDKDLLKRAFIHRSYVNESKDDSISHNERLEFLGDAVLELIVTDYLFKEFPEKTEGELSELRSRIIEGSACYTYVDKLDVQDFLLMGKGEMANVGRGRFAIIADLFEAIIGAVYLDGGISKARQYFHEHFLAEMRRLIKKPTHNWKAELQDYSQKKYKIPPEYRLTKEEGPDHLKTFCVDVFVNKEHLGNGFGNSKKEAEQMAAERAMKQIKRNG